MGHRRARAVEGDYTVHLYISSGRVILRCIIGGIICVLTLKPSQSK